MATEAELRGYYRHEHEYRWVTLSDGSGLLECPPCDQSWLIDPVTTQVHPCEEPTILTAYERRK